MADELKAENLKLKTELAEKEKNLQLAASFGSQLLNSENNLKEKLSSLTTEYNDKFEFLQQENHSLRQKLATKIQVEGIHISEFESLKLSLEDTSQCLEKIRKAELEACKQIEELTKDREFLRKNNEDLKEINADLESKFILSEGKLAELEGIVNHSVLNESCSEELMSLKAELSSVTEKKDELVSSLCEARKHFEEIKREKEELISQCADLKEELKSKDLEIASYFAALKKNKEDIEELEGEIELLKLEQVDENRRGNSVFSEVEDRRKSLETQMVSVKSKYKEMQKNYSTAVEELERTKFQLNILLSSRSQKVDSSYIEKLEISLSQAKAEVLSLTLRLNDNLKVTETTPQVDNGDMYQYLRTMLEESQNQVKKMQTELQSVRLKCIEESDKCIQSERKLYQAENRIETLERELLQLKIEIKNLTERKNGAAIEESPLENIEKKVLKEQNVKSPTIFTNDDKKRVTMSNVLTVSDENGDITTDKTNFSSSKERSNGRQRTKAPILHISSQNSADSCKQQ